MKNIFFVGLKHSGKTLFSHIVASHLSLRCFDLDELILDDIDLSIRDFYKKYGKDAFMEKEKNAYNKLKKKEDEGYILSLGGGVSDNTLLMEELKKDGVIVYLEREEEDMLPFILKSGIPPFLDKDNLTSSFHDLYERRDKIYSSYASLIIKLGRYGDKEKTAKLIIDSLKENGYV